MENQQANKILSNIGKLTSQVREETEEISPITNGFLISSLPPLQFDIDLFRFFNRYIHMHILYLYQTLNILKIQIFHIIEISRNFRFQKSTNLHPLMTGYRFDF
jgi:hypothetical protein